MHTSICMHLLLTRSLIFSIERNTNHYSYSTSFCFSCLSPIGVCYLGTGRYVCGVSHGGRVFNWDYIHGQPSPRPFGLVCMCSCSIFCFVRQTNFEHRSAAHQSSPLWHRRTCHEFGQSQHFTERLPFSTIILLLLFLMGLPQSCFRHTDIRSSWDRMEGSIWPSAELVRHHAPIECLKWSLLANLSIFYLFIDAS